MFSFHGALKDTFPLKRKAGVFKFLDPFEERFRFVFVTDTEWTITKMHECVFKFLPPQCEPDLIFLFATTLWQKSFASFNLLGVFPIRLPAKKYNTVAIFSYPTTKNVCS